MSEPRFGVWTPVSERLPSGIGRKNTVVLAAWNGDEVSEASVFKIGDQTIWIRGIATSDPPLAWMPMPTHPEAEEEERRKRAAAAGLEAMKSMRRNRR